jgi:hypothetical protein
LEFLSLDLDFELLEQLEDDELELYLALLFLGDLEEEDDEEDDEEEDEDEGDRRRFLCKVNFCFEGVSCFVNWGFPAFSVSVTFSVGKFRCFSLLI